MGAIGSGSPLCVILVVDDEKPVRNFVQHILTTEGYAVMSAGDGQEALELSRKYPGKIDLIVTDIQMPRMDGPQLAEHIKVERPDTHVLLMSGYASDMLRQYAMTANFIGKPFTPKMLTAKVAELLNASQSQGMIAEL